MIYLDYAASTPVPHEVMDKMLPLFCEQYGNPSSSHQYGLSASNEVNKVREIVADKIGAYPSEIVFTSGASESNNLAIKGFALANKNQGSHIVTSAIEHKCILSICHFLEDEGFEVTYLQPDSNGLISANKVANAIKKDTLLVSISHVNNELGTIQPISEIGALCFEKDVLFHSDAAQSFCKLNIDVDDMNIDLLSISAHKCYGPKGVGALYIRDIRETKITPIIHGAGQELGLRGGTLPSPLIAGMGEAIRRSKQYINQNEIFSVQKAFLEELSKHCTYKINGGTDTVPNILNITIPNLDLIPFKDDNDLSIPQGSACSSMNIEISHVLGAIGLSFEEGEKTLRVSFGYGITVKSATIAAQKLCRHIQPR